MISAEHFALEHDTVRQLLEIRSQEVTQMCNHFNAIGMQAALIAGFVVTSLTAVVGDVILRPDVHPLVRYTFWISSSLSLVCCVHCLLNSTFAAVWGPGLALRGPSGSVSRAFFGMRREGTHIQWAFNGSLFFFVVQSSCAFIIIDGESGLTPPSVISVVLLVVGSAVSVYLFSKMKKRLFVEEAWGLSNLEDEEMRNFGAEDLLLFRHDTPSSQDMMKDITAAMVGTKVDTEGGAAAATSSLTSTGGNSFITQGGKAATASSDGSGATARSAASASGSSEKKTSLFNQLTMLGESRRLFRHEGWMEQRKWLVWYNRYFVLANATLYWWQSKEQSEADRRGKPRGPWEGAKSISLEGFEVLVYQQKEGKDDEFEFLLSPLGPSNSNSTSSSSSTSSASYGSMDGRKDFAIFGGKSKQHKRHYRCHSETERKAWVQALVASSLVSQR
eukprot:gb/GEZN01006802.1/.p1 GENE.gb/GEZN01006802.1/~~gb/GEZN01006802.1/.p1  ORF type:complete len:446 (-),score=86.15 gb/GEZN01006802.1/:219-1556(-)